MFFKKKTEKEVLTPTKQIIKLLEEDPEGWQQHDYVLVHIKSNIQIWTGTKLQGDMTIHKPKRKTSVRERNQMRDAVLKWHRRPLKFENDHAMS